MTTEAPTLPTTPSSAEPAVAAPPLPPVEAPVVASPPTPTSPVTPTPTKAERPEWVPESFFDPDKGEVKGADLRKHLDELATFKAAEDSRRATLPQSPEGYEATLPEGFRAPDGVDVKIDVNDPMFKSARELAHAKGWSQSDFSDALGIVAAMKAQEAATYETMKAKNLEGLGTKGPERIDAVTRYLNANFPEGTVKPVLATMATKAHVEMFEAFISKLASQGRGSTFTQTGRDVDTGKVDDATWDKMSYSQKKEYTAKHSGQAA